MIIYKGRWEWLMKPWVKASSAPTGLCSFWTGGGCFESKRDSLHSIGEWLAVFLKRQNFYRQLNTCTAVLPVPSKSTTAESLVITCGPPPGSIYRAFCRKILGD